MTIYKYPLRWEEIQTIHMPAGAEPLALQIQDHVPTLWAKVDFDATEAAYAVNIYGTGEQLPTDPGRYLGTLQSGDGYVYHFFYQGDFAEG